MSAPQKQAGPGRTAPGWKASSNLPGAASLSYTVANIWEQTAILSPSQEAALDQLADLCLHRSIPPHIQQPGAAAGEGQAGQTSSRPATAAGTAEAGLSTSATANGESLEEAVLQNANQLYRWHAELEAARTIETEEKYRQYAATLQGHLQTCSSIMQAADDALELFEQLKAQHRDVSSKTKSLHDSCERLVSEKDGLVEFADALHSRLSYFDELERIASHFHAASLAVDSTEFMPLLKRLDDCITFVTANPQYADSGAYAGRFRQLQARALATVRSKVQQVLRYAAEQVAAAVRQGSPSTSGRPLENGNGAHAITTPRSQPPQRLPESAETALLYVRFRTVAEPGLKGLLGGIGERRKRPEYARLLSDCHQIYCEMRILVMGPIVRERVAAHAEAALTSLMRSGCSYLLQVCTMEHQLFEAFFPGEAADGAALSLLIQPLCTILYDTLRPRYIQLQDLDELCQLVDILQQEVLEEGVQRKGDAVAAMRPVLGQTLADIQARLIFRAQAFIKDAVAGFQPKTADLDYPARLMEATAASNGTEEAEADPLIPLSNGDAHLSMSNSEEQRESGAETYPAWYAPVQRTLLCLSKLYRCVDAHIFSGLAQEAVAACTISVQLASRVIGKKAGALDGQLFLIKQLLILREQIAPFEAEFAVTEKDLDFSHMRNHMRRILGGQGSIFSLSADNAMLQLVGRGPRIIESQVDSKKELDKLLKATCEAFIMAITKLTVEPMLSFITKVTAFRVAPALSAGQPLRQQAFAKPERLAEMVGKVREALQSALPKAVNKMKLYLSNASTHGILFRPIKSNVAEAHGQIASLLESDYTSEDAELVQLLPPPELSALLDSIC
ncbi:hypothetical protein WJX74_002000 [Apatococcus lobatus]|uniref:Conserved oligomeric Golgi complex subunit 3 n=2 Tax=Apatococcus TaxID=904362 RepID=A0AAW1RXV2_9CHLO